MHQLHVIQKMNAKSLKNVYLWSSRILATGSILTVFYTLHTIFILKTLHFSFSFIVLIAYAIYALSLAFRIQRNLYPRLTHEYLSAVFCPIGFLAVVIFLSGDESISWLQALGAIFIFFLIGGIYKATLAYSGKILFGNEIIDR
jgi:hypothetical protein